jgi:hypothetical protein
MTTFILKLSGRIGLVALLSLGVPAISGAQSTEDIPTKDLHTNDPSRQDVNTLKRVQAWENDGTQVIVLKRLQSFFGTEVGRYVADAPGASGGATSIYTQVYGIFQDAAANDRALPNGARLLVTERRGERMLRVYVALKNSSATSPIVAVGLTYYAAPVGGYIPSSGPSKGHKVTLEDLPSLVFFYPKDATGTIQRDSYLEQVISDEARDFFTEFLPLTHTADDPAVVAVASHSNIFAHIDVRGVLGTGTP